MKQVMQQDRDLSGKFKKDNKAARLPLEIDWNQAGYLCQIHCTREEVAAFFGVSVRTLERRCKTELGIPFADFYALKKELGRTSLRRKQFIKAIGEKTHVVTRKIHPDGTVEEKTTEEYILPPSVPMQIWLGKNMLGQREKVEIEQQETKRVFIVKVKQNANQS